MLRLLRNLHADLATVRWQVTTNVTSTYEFVEDTASPGRGGGPDEGRGAASSSATAAGSSSTAAAELQAELANAETEPVRYLPGAAVPQPGP